MILCWCSCSLVLVFFPVGVLGISSLHCLDWMKGIIVEVVRVSMCRFRFKLCQAVVQRCRMICFKFMYWLRLGAVVPVWFCISSILQYQGQLGTNWLNRCIVPFLRHSADASLWGRLSLRQAGSSFHAVMHEHSPQGLFRRRPLKLVGLCWAQGAS